MIAPGASAHTFVNVTDRLARRCIQIVPALDAVAFLTDLGEMTRRGKLDQDALRPCARQPPASSTALAAIGNALPAFTPAECENYFTAAGYEPE